MIYGFDIETTLMTEGSSPKFKLWTMYGETQFFGYDRKSLLAQVYSFWNSLGNEIREDIIIVAHNLQFDYCLSFQKFYFPDLYRTSINIMDKPVFAKFTKKRVYKKHRRYALIFVDLMNYVQGSLKQVAEAFDVPRKLDDQNYIEKEQHDNELLKYCMRDSEITQKVLSIINPFVNSKFHLTISSYSYKLLKSSSGWKKFYRPLFIEKIERQAYFGGRTQPNYKLMNELEFDIKPVKGIKLDINSMYPYAMRNLKVPVKLIEIINKVHDPEILLEKVYNSEELTCIFTGTVTTVRDCLPYKNQEEKLTFEPREKISGSWSNMELYPALRDKECEIIKCDSIVLYETQKYMFADYVDKYYEIKKNSKGVKRQLAKLLLNTAYGKFGQKRRINRSSEIENWLKNNDEYQLEQLLQKEYYITDIVDHENDNVMYENVQVVNGYIVKSEILNVDDKNSCTVVAVSISAWSRNMLREAMRAIKGNWYYCDTDSLLLPDLKDFPSKWIGNDLGQWKIETCSAGSDSCNYLIKGKKDYACKHDIYLKGVPKVDINKNKVVTQQTFKEGIFHFWKVVKPRESLRRGLNMFSTIEMTKIRKY